MAAAIGDVSWLEQSLWDPRKKNALSKEHVRNFNLFYYSRMLANFGEIMT